MKFIAIALLFSSLLQAWHAKGHMEVARIAYNHLSPATRARVNAILKTHPDYEKWGGDDRDLEAFLQASIWPDKIKTDPRFYDDIVRDATPTPPLPGIPDTAMHKNWHYINIPIETNGSRNPPPLEPNAESAIREITVDLSNPYNLSWMIHITGDLHQPLHTVARFTGNIGDQGGNLFLLAGPVHTLHSLWDGAGSESSVIPSADSIVHLDTQTWIREGVELAKSEVYSISENSTPSEAYIQKMMKISRQRIALAGYRLAAILNDRLQ